MAKKIAVIKTGWSDDFKGSPVQANHKHVKKFKDGHEKFNFLAGPDGRFYAYTPPLGETDAAPQPKDPEDWLVFAVAKRPNRSGLYLTGWYEGATFEKRYVPRIEYKRSKAFPLDDHGERFSFTLSSDEAVQIDPDETPHVFPGDHMKRSPIYYLRGNGKKGEWCDTLAEELLAIRRAYKTNERHVIRAKVGGGRGGICADPERRKQVEEKAIAEVMAKYPKPKFEVVDRQKDNCGFDLLVRTIGEPKAELHIEVKGTQNTKPHFLMSRREYAYMLANPRNWRLAMVTSALAERPKLEVLNASEARQRFFWEEFTWHATSRP